MPSRLSIKCIELFDNSLEDIRKEGDEKVGYS